MDLVPILGEDPELDAARALVDTADLWEWEREEYIVVLEAKDEQLDQFKGLTTYDFGTQVCGIVPNEEQRKRDLPWWTPQNATIWDSVAAHAATMVFSGNGIGKTFSEALEILTRYYRGYKVVTTAPVARQVETLWAKIRVMKQMAETRKGIILPGKWLDTRPSVVMPHDREWTLRGYTARVGASEQVATAFQGEHYTRVFVCIDEFVGCGEAILEAAERLLTGAEDKYLGCGNPTDPTSYAARAAKITDKNTGKPIYNVIHLSSEDHPNVIHDFDIIPGAASRRFCERQLAKGGGSRDSTHYRTSVRGLFPFQAEDALIRSEWIEAAKFRGEERRLDWKRPRNQQRWPKDRRGIALGLDVAGEGKDLTVLTACESGRIFWPDLHDENGEKLLPWHQGKDHLQAVNLIVRALHCLPRVLSVAIDDTGLGAAVSAELFARSKKEFPEIPIYVVKGPLRTPDEYYRQTAILRVNFGGAPFPLADIDPEVFGCAKDTLWWQFREDLRKGIMALPSVDDWRAAGFPEDNDLFAQIVCALAYRDDKRVLHILDKRSSLGGRFRKLTEKLPTISPDLAHSAMLAWHAFKQLPEAIAGPETVEESFATKKEAMIAAAQVRPPGSQPPNRNLAAWQRRAR